MPLYVIIGRDGPEGLERRKTVRPAHIRNMQRLDAAGRVRFAGPLRDEAGQPCGSVIVLEAADLAAARAEAEGDPYWTDGVFGTLEVFESLQVFPEPAGSDA